MIAAIAVLHVKEGMAAEFEAAFAKLAAAVRAGEPGNRVYQLTRPQGQSTIYKVLEIYDSPEAVQAHRDSAHFKELGAPLGPLLSARTEVERLDVV